MRIKSTCIYCARSQLIVNMTPLGSGYYCNDYLTCNELFVDIQGKVPRIYVDPDSEQDDTESDEIESGYDA